MNKARLFFSLMFVIVLCVAAEAQSECPDIAGSLLPNSMIDQYNSILDMGNAVGTLSQDSLNSALANIDKFKSSVEEQRFIWDFDNQTVGQCNSLLICMDSYIIPLVEGNIDPVSFGASSENIYTPPSGAPDVSLSNLDLTSLDAVAGALRQARPEIYDSIDVLQDSLASRNQLFTNLAVSDHFIDNLAARRLTIVEGKSKEIDLLWKANKRWSDSLIIYQSVIEDLNQTNLAQEIQIRNLQNFRVRAVRSVTYPEMDAFMIWHGNMAGFYYSPTYAIHGADARIKSKDFFGVPFDLYARINGKNAINRAVDKNFIVKIPLDLNLEASVFKLGNITPGIQYHSKSFYNPQIPVIPGVQPRQIPSNDVHRFVPWEVGLEGNIWQFDLNFYTTQYHTSSNRISASTASLGFRFPADTSDGRGNRRALKDDYNARLWSIETFVTFTDDIDNWLPYAGKYNTYFGLGASNGAHNLIYAKNIQNRMLGKSDFDMLDLFPLAIDKTLLGLYFYAGTKAYNEYLGIDFFVGTKSPPLLIRVSTYEDANSKWLSTNISPRLTHVDVVPKRFGEIEVWWLRDFFPIGLEISIPDNTAFPYEVRISTFLNIRN